MTMVHRSGHAVVIGGSMAGLLAARALDGFFDLVTILDRDSFPEQFDHRRHVPQSRHVHVLLARGRAILEAQFPGITDELVSHGATSRDIGRSSRSYFGRDRLSPGDIGEQSMLVSRPLLEGHVRRRLAATPSVRFLEGYVARGLVADEGVVTGIRLGGSVDSPLDRLEADLVVDATGRSSQTPGWLATMGYPSVAEDVVKVGLGYASRTFERRSDDLDGDLVVLVTATPTFPRVGVAVAIEGNRWHVTLGGFAGDHPPTDPVGWQIFAEQLSVSDIADLVRSAPPLCDPVPFRYTASVRRRYERMKRFPEHFVVVGDALCSFNPVYGQGMTVAAMECEILRSCLESGLDRIGPRFFRQVKKIVDSPWSIAVGGDLRFPHVEGRPTLKVRVLNRFLDRFAEAAADDVVLARQITRVVNLLERPESLAAPAIAIRGLVRRGRGRNP